MKNGIRDAECCNNCAFGHYFYGTHFCRIDKAEMPDEDEGREVFLKWAKTHEVEIDTVCDDFACVF